jgi:NADH dehydrogenase
MPGNRLRVAVDWFLDAVLPKSNVQLGLVRSGAVPLDSATPELPTSAPPLQAAATGREARRASGES